MFIHEGIENIDAELIGEADAKEMIIDEIVDVPCVAEAELVERHEEVIERDAVIAEPLFGEAIDAAKVALGADDDAPPGLAEPLHECDGIRAGGGEGEALGIDPLAKESEFRAEKNVFVAGTGAHHGEIFIKEVG